MKINQIINTFFYFIFKNKLYRRLILIAGDVAVVPIAFIISLTLIYGEINFGLIENYILLNIIFICFNIPINIISGQYSSLTSYLGFRIFLQIFFRNLLAVILVKIIDNLLFNNLISFSISTIIIFYLTFLNLFFRYLIRKFLILYTKKNNKEICKIAIYGAGISGINIATNLNLLGSYQIISFIDENSDLWGRYIAGVPIRSPSKIDHLKGKIDKVLISLDDIGRSKRKNIIDHFQKLDIPVLIIPSVFSVASGKIKVDDLRQVNISDLLERKFFTNKNNSLDKFLNNKVICVTGAGGSIGSALCMQIIKYNPKKLILIERCELNLYKLEEEIMKEINQKIKVKFVLACVMDKKVIKKIFIEEEVQLVLHTAAYKHVPIVEKNPMQGVQNNVLTTKVLCQASFETNVEKFCLISTDKAVRPTNIMGASKRLAELIVQYYSMLNNKQINSENFTYFSMVRFGNVLDSSGSVVPRFRKQIKDGGPITITHPKITRFFMTLSEASNLVLESLLYSKGGDLFLLDMGEPVLIKELASQMIKLSGLQLKNKENPNGDIEIVYTGLRPGEKLYEELLIDAEALPTENPYIFRAKEKFLEASFFLSQMRIIEESILNNNLNTMLTTLKKIVPEWEGDK